MRAALQAANVKVVSPQELGFAMERGGLKLLDVRPGDLYEKGHVPGAFNVPFYQPIQGWSPWQAARRLGYALFGVLNGTEANPRFLEEVKQQAGTEEQLLVYCSLGGSLEGGDNSRHGRQTRSMIAAYQLVSNGYTNVGVLKGGFSSWAQSGREVAAAEAEEGDSQPQGSMEGSGEGGAPRTQ